MNLDDELTDDEDFLELVQHVRHPRAERVFRERSNHYEKWNDEEFKARFRQSKNVVRRIEDEIGDNITSVTMRSHALTASEMIFIMLRFLATGCFLQTAGDFNGVDKSTACRVIYKVARAIAALSPRVINMPRSEEEITDVRQGFYNISRFPRCLGALDCTHVKITSPGKDNAEIFRNRKGYFSYNVQVVCDANLQIRNIVCRWPGSAHDAHIFRSSNLRAQFENGMYGDSLLVGDSGYGIKPYLITPLANVATRAENLFNESQIRTRNPIERCFGVWKRRFPILALGIRCKIENVEAIVVACAVLHNVACHMRDENPPVDDEIEAAVNIVFPENAVEDRQRAEGNDAVRNTLINEYF
ncbi:hypothetical protein MML48_7g00015984 [Holotrichia oblita]|uniref:Uncharacterized protein n=1 Tax=Holotrichia oblita TaxID=644536 RepID=A0ACB9SUD9_HOLOL|nr:hypothetical protein MML48_7g00015984 [Holotrichia oblita]